MSALLTVRQAGPGVTVQDAGRQGHLRFGVTPAGPMDWAAFETANRALGNAPNAAAFEIGLGGLALETDAPTVLAFAGGGFAWSHGDRTLPSAARILLRPDEVLVARPGAWGAFAYCAVPGGLRVPLVMGSRATHTRSSLGGIDGRGLRAGDRLPVARAAPDLDDAGITGPWLARSDAPIRVTLGPQDDYFTPAALDRLATADFQLTPQADRMAYKFAGPALSHLNDFNIVSDGIALGAIQVAGDGQPLVLMADRQPTGGYPKIAHVCRADIGRLAQLRPGDRCRFAPIDLAAARAAFLDLADRVARTDEHMAPLRLPPGTARLWRENLIGGVVRGTGDDG